MSTTARAIVVGYDGSPDADRALEWAATASRRYAAPVHVLTARDVEPDPVRLGGGVGAWETTARRRLDRAARRLTAAGADLVTVQASPVPPAAALIEASDAALMVVLGARGRSRLAGLLLGSVSQHVTRHARCPVVVVREQASPRAREVVVGVDGSPTNESAIRFAFEAAHRTHAGLVAVHGCPADVAVVGSLSPLSANLVDCIQAGERLLEEALAPPRREFPGVRLTAEAVPVHPIRLLADVSEHAALVVVGSRGRGGFTGLLLGSVSQGVLHHAQCSVGVVR